MQNFRRLFTDGQDRRVNPLLTGAGKRFFWTAVLGTVFSVGAFATPIGTVAVDGCNGGGVTVTLTTIDFTNQCVQTGAGTFMTSSSGTLLPGVQGVIFDINSLPPVNPFMTFDPPPAGDIITFALNSIGPGSANTNCGIGLPCSIFAGSPFILIPVGNGTTVSLGVGGIVSDATGSANWSGVFSSNFATTTPAQLQAQFLASGSLSSTTFSGNITASVIPEPGSLALMGLGLIGVGLARKKASRRS